MESLKIIVLSVAAAVAYGIVHDQVTARVCVEYFTIGHPQLFVVPTDDPTLLGIGWGIVATWWVGLPLGIGLAIAGPGIGLRPRRSARSLIVPIAKLLGVMAVCALAAAVTGWLLARSRALILVGSLAEAYRQKKHVAFLADLWAHNASYLVGIVGGIVLVSRIWKSRDGENPIRVSNSTD